MTAEYQSTSHQRFQTQDKETLEEYSETLHFTHYPAIALLHTNTHLFPAQQDNGIIYPRQLNLLLNRYSQFKKAIIQHLGISRPPKFYYFGSKLGNNLHTKLRLNISNLKSHQFQIQKADSTACTCGHNQENTAHFVLSCPLYTHLRNYLYQSISQILNIHFITFPSSFKLDILLHGKDLNTDDGGKVASSFQNFLIKTKRFC